VLNKVYAMFRHCVDDPSACNDRVARFSRNTVFGDLTTFYGAQRIARLP
jgi:hypothetical protein